LGWYEKMICSAIRQTPIPSHSVLPDADGCHVGSSMDAARSPLSPRRLVSVIFDPKDLAGDGVGCL
jgi:hypothetical protein